MGTGDTSLPIVLWVGRRGANTPLARLPPGTEYKAVLTPCGSAPNAPLKEFKEISTRGNVSDLNHNKSLTLTLPYPSQQIHTN